MTIFPPTPPIGTQHDGATLVRVEECISCPSNSGAVVLHWQRSNGTTFATAVMTKPRPQPEPNLDF